MWLITGTAGFIASAYVRRLNQLGLENLILVDDFSPSAKRRNWQDLRYSRRVERQDLWLWLAAEKPLLQGIIHLGARTDTTEHNEAIFQALNLEYSQKLFRYAAQRGLPFIYASSAATYGLGELGYSDELHPAQLLPLNPYGRSKNDFDAWVLAQSQVPPFWAGLKFFNVYGPGEYHKGRMASVVWHSYGQIRRTGGMKLFRSHRPDVADGAQSRDFIHVDNVLDIIEFMRLQQPASGLYNVGTGQARSFHDLVSACFQALKLPAQISFMDTPADIRDTYQYFTQADLGKLRRAGYALPFLSLEEGVEHYVQTLQKGLL